MSKQKWEYCAITGVTRKFGRQAARKLVPYWPAIWYFTKHGVEVVEIKGDEKTLVGRAIAQLGQDGWEMAGCLSEAISLAASSQALYFKRPIEE